MSVIMDDLSIIGSGIEPQGLLGDAQEYFTHVPVLYLSPPNTLIATPVNGTTVDLSWTDTANNEDGFEIQRSLTGVAGTWASIDGTDPDVTTYSDTSCNPETTYYYRVRAYNTSGADFAISVWSNVVSVTTLTPFTNWDVLSAAHGTILEYGHDYIILQAALLSGSYYAVIVSDDDNHGAICDPIEIVSGGASSIAHYWNDVGSAINTATPTGAIDSGPGPTQSVRMLEFISTTPYTVKVTMTVSNL